MSCASFDKTEISSALLTDHVIRLNRDGLMTDPDIAKAGYWKKTFTKPLREDKAKTSIVQMLEKAKQLATTKHSTHPGHVGEKIKVKLLIHVHGGLNTFSSTDERVYRYANAIQCDADDWHYPIYVSWPSNAFGTWFENAFSIREGRKTTSALGILSAPFIITSDIFRSLGRYPITAWYQLVNEKDWAASNLQPDWLSRSWKEARKNFCELKKSGHSDKDCNNHFAQYKNISLYYSDYNSRFLNALGKGTLEAITFPVRLTAGTLWHSAIAVSAWDNMKRRTHNIFFPTQNFDVRFLPEDNLGKYPGFSGGKFFEEILDAVIDDNQQKSKYQYEITLVGHSMGTIVINHALNTYQHKWLKSAALKNIVYMAAAATIDDSLNALLPLLKPYRSELNPPNFYNLSLNRVSEVSESHVLGIVPTGSLLVSIDQHYEDPEHPLKRTLGSEVNVLSAFNAISKRLKDTSGKIVFKAFDRCSGSLPDKHGSFNDIPYWKESVWNVQTQTPNNECGEGINKFNAYLDIKDTFESGSDASCPQPPH